jgi:hypothetical protein
MDVGYTTYVKASLAEVLFQGAGGRETSVLPPFKRGPAMTEPTLDYRIWQCGVEWHWQVMTKLRQVLASGIANGSAAARIAAFKFCLRHEGKHFDT